MGCSIRSEFLVENSWSRVFIYLVTLTLIGIFRPFTFKVIINMLGLIAPILFVVFVFIPTAFHFSVFFFLPPVSHLTI